MANSRLYYAVSAVGLAPYCTTNFVTVHGVQSCSISTNFNLEQVFELGQLEIYENIEALPDIQVDLEKVIDGYPLIYHLATRGGTSDTLAGRQNQRCMFTMSIFDDDQDSASGTPLSQVVCSGMYVNSLSYTMPVDGNCTESVSLVGNDKVWKTSSFTFSGSLFDNTDEPLALTSGWGGVQRRENVIFGGLSDTLLPPDIPGISSSGTNDKTGDEFGAHVQTISISADFGREQLNELGRKKPYFRYMSFPLPVDCSIEVTTTRGDMVDGREDVDSNVTNRTIQIKLQDSTFIDLGDKNKLASVTFAGHDAGGGNATCTYNYQNFNHLSVSHDMNPG